MDLVKGIKENLEKGVEAVKEIVEDGVELFEEGIEKVKEISEDVKEKIVGEKEPKIKNISKKSKKEDGFEEKTNVDLKKLAEAESLEGTEEAKSLEEKKKAILEKAKKLSKKIDVTTSEELKEKIKIKKRTDMLLPLEEYVKVGIYLGTKVVTPDMKNFVYRRRADGLAIFNTDLIDEKLKEGIEYLSKFEAKDIVLVCKRQAGWKAATLFAKFTGIRTFTKKYPAGILTNTQLPNFFENKLTIVTDSWIDKNALKDTLIVKKNILMICDTNNFSKGADQIIIGNNKSPKSLGVIFYLLAKGYCKSKGIDVNIPDLEWWTSEEDN